MRASFFLSALALVCVVGFGAQRVAAQISPADSGVGVLRGIQDQNNSGQVGTISLFRRGAKTLVVLDVDGEPSGIAEPAHVHRGKTCGRVDPKPAFPLGAVRNGHSSALVPISLAQLTSGNYVVNVHSSSNIAHYVACGEITPGS